MYGHVGYGGRRNAPRYVNARAGRHLGKPSSRGRESVFSGRRSQARFPKKDICWDCETKYFSFAMCMMLILTIAAVDIRFISEFLETPETAPSASPSLKVCMHQMPSANL